MTECSFQLLFCRYLMGALIVGFVKGKTCWDTTWYNSSSPAVHGGSDVETVNMTVLDSICPDGGSVVAAHCKDEKGEPFTGFKNDYVNHYIANCTVDNGLQCHPYTSIVGASCADFAIQYGCNCSTTTTTIIATTTATETTTKTTTPPKSTSETKITTAFTKWSALLMSTTTKTIPLKSASSKRTTTMFPTGRSFLLSLTTKTTTTKPTSKSALATKTTTMFPTGAAYLTSSTRVANVKAENNTVFEKWKITGAECPGAKLQIGTWCVMWWIPLLVVSGSLFAINIVVSVCLYKAQRTRNSKIQPLGGDLSN